MLEVGDGIARVYGLSGVMAGEMVEFTRTEVRGLAFNLEENSVGVIILGDYLEIAEGDEVRSHRAAAAGAGRRGPDRPRRRPARQPAGRQGPDRHRPDPPGRNDRPRRGRPAAGQTPLQTGIKAIDAMTPIGRGQRELIIGDRKTGKTAIAIDTIINQKTRTSSASTSPSARRNRRSPRSSKTCASTGRWITPSSSIASSADPAPLQYIAPYAGCAMAEYFMYEQGRDTLCVYDDLTKQAAAYRQLSLLMRRPPGREAYPGDIFYCPLAPAGALGQARRRYVIVPADADDAKVGDDWGVNRNDGRSRAARSTSARPGKEHAEKHDLPKHARATSWPRSPNSGGSLTALPIIETLEGEVSAYIPTNVISITDGQIYLQPDLFFAGVRPAVDVGISVSRVGGKAQIPAMKQVAGGSGSTWRRSASWKRSPSSAPSWTRRRSRSSTAATAWSRS